MIRNQNLRGKNREADAGEGGGKGQKEGEMEGGRDWGRMLTGAAPSAFKVSR